MKDEAARWGQRRPTLRHYQKKKGKEMNDCYDELYLKVEWRHWRELRRRMEELFSTERRWRHFSGDLETRGKWSFMRCDKQGYVLYTAALVVIDEETLRLGNISARNEQPLNEVEHRGVLRDFYHNVLAKLCLPFQMVVLWKDGDAVARTKG